MHRWQMKIYAISHIYQGQYDKEGIKTRGTPGTKQSPEWDERKILNCSIK